MAVVAWATRGPAGRWGMAPVLVSRSQSRQQRARVYAMSRKTSLPLNIKLNAADTATSGGVALFLDRVARLTGLHDHPGTDGAGREHAHGWCSDQMV